MPKVTFIIDGESQVVEFEHGRLPYSHHGQPESFLDLAKNLGIPLEHAEADFAARLLIEARNEAETVIRATEKSLRAPDFAEMARTDLARGEPEQIEAALSELKLVLGGQDREIIQQRTHALNEATRHLAELMMNRSVQAALSGRNIDRL